MNDRRALAAYLIGRFFLGAVFFYAGLAKLTEPSENFRGILAQYEVIPYAAVPFIAAVLPWIEFLAGAFLMLGYLPRWSALTLALLSLGFLIVLGSSELLLGSTPASCGCFGDGPIHLTVRQVFILDIADLAIGLKLCALHDHPFSVDRLLSKASS